MRRPALIGNTPPAMRRHRAMITENGVAPMRYAAARREITLAFRQLEPILDLR
jgi:hypothetical protein